VSEDATVDDLRERAGSVLKKLSRLGSARDLAAAKTLVEELRNLGDYETMGRLAEAVSRRDPADPTNRRLYAQCLIETGKATAAIACLKPVVQTLPRKHKEYAEATGLLGRAYKQIFFDADDKTSEAAREALKQAIAAYREPYERNRANTWHGVNLVALLARARGLGLRFASDLDARKVARQVVATLEATPKTKRDEWFLPNVAEASLGLGDWHRVERYVRSYAAVPDAKAFQLASTLRQFTQVWDLEATDARGRGLVSILRARLMELPGGELEFAPRELQRLRKQAPPPGQLEAVLGPNGSQTFDWWRTGLDRALSVAAVRRRLGGRIGTGFLVRARDFARQPEDELLILTNFHVVNEHGASQGIRPQEAEVIFEAVHPKKAHPVDSILKSSPPDRHDASLLRLKTNVTGIEPLPFAAALPVVDETARVYIVGHPGGRDLAFSFQDNELLDHEGPPDGRPQIPGVCRLHYRAPTEGGSSGSPVFNRLWEVIALHHKGGKTGMPMLNGKPGTYAANEGISILSIAAELRA
jgi:hypothetical protein